MVKTFNFTTHQRFVCVTLAEALAQPTVPVGSPVHPLVLLEEEHTMDCNVFATTRFKRGEETYCANKHSPGLKNEHPKGRRKFLEGGGGGKMGTAWKSLAQRRGHGPCSMSEGAALAIGALCIQLAPV